VCSLAAHATDGWSGTFRGAVLGRDQLGLWARGLDTFTADRARYDPAQFYDVQYETFTADPVGTVAEIYSYFGLPLSGAAETAMRALHAASTAGDARPAHHYALADFGLTPAEVDGNFAGR
jgi:hypothetical protein